MIHTGMLRVLELTTEKGKTMKKMMASDERQKGFEEGYAKGREEGRNITAHIEHDLSVKCNSLAEENAKLHDFCNQWEQDFKELTNECNILKAQMDVVYLIFGGRE